jgi:hypothetical protein
MERAGLFVSKCFEITSSAHDAKPELLVCSSRFSARERRYRPEISAAFASSAWGNTMVAAKNQSSSVERRVPAQVAHESLALDRPIESVSVAIERGAPIFAFTTVAYLGVR